jgi:hypothetical protein
MTSIPWDDVVADYESGTSYADLAARYKTSRQTLYKGLKRLGVQLRGHAKGSDHPNWRGGRRINASGYVRVWVDPSSPFSVMVPDSEKSSHVLEHRLVMAEALERPLRDDEEVHHLNGDKTDNRIENLQLLVGKHGHGVRYECQICGSHDVGAVAL